MIPIPKWVLPCFPATKAELRLVVARDSLVCKVENTYSMPLQTSWQTSDLEWAHVSSLYYCSKFLIGTSASVLTPEPPLSKGQ